MVSEIYQLLSMYGDLFDFFDDNAFIDLNKNKVNQNTNICMEHLNFSKFETKHTWSFYY